MPKRKSYTAEFKLEVVKYPEDIGSNRKAAIDGIKLFPKTKRMKRASGH